MSEMLFPILFWLSIPLSLTFSVMSILRNQYGLALIGAVLFIPLSYYFNGSPAVNGYGLFMPVFQVISAAAVREGNKFWAWLFLLPAFLTVGWFVALALINQFS